MMVGMEMEMEMKMKMARKKNCSATNCHPLRGEGVMACDEGRVAGGLGHRTDGEMVSGRIVWTRGQDFCWCISWGKSTTDRQRALPNYGNWKFSDED